jgi:hypothetical protein
MLSGCTHTHASVYACVHAATPDAGGEQGVRGEAQDTAAEREGTTGQPAALYCGFSHRFANAMYTTLGML